MSDKVIRLNDLFQELLDLGLWPRELSPPEPSILERIYNLDTDLHKRLTELSVPETSLQMVDQIREEYKEQLLIKEKKKPKQKKSLWVADKKKYIVFLGKGVSAKLQERDEETKKLKKHKLPSLKTIRALTNLTKTNKKTLMKICFHHRVSEYSHYVDFDVPKKIGGVRKISSPKHYLKQIQYQIKEKILDKLQVPDHVTGFEPGKSIAENANVHLSATRLINLDIENFFPSINYYQVRSFFKNLGYSGLSASVLGLLTTKQEVKKVKIEEKVYYTLSEERYLPQGAPTSPQISNHIALRMDDNIIRRTSPLGFKYTRYADDMTLSTTDKKAKIKATISIVRKSAKYFGFKIHDDKIKVLGKHERQEITGLVINEGKITIPRIWRRKLRAKLHKFKIERLGNPEEILSSIMYMKQFHPKKAAQYLEIFLKVINSDQK